MQAMITPTSEERPLVPSDRLSLWHSVSERSLDLFDRSHVTDTPPESALERLVEHWADVAVTHARVRSADEGFVADVVGIDGAWGFGRNPKEAVNDLRQVLPDWANFKLEDGDDDIPSMEGLSLVLTK